MWNACMPVTDVPSTSSTYAFSGGCVCVSITVTCPQQQTPAHAQLTNHPTAAAEGVRQCLSLGTCESSGLLWWLYLCLYYSY